MKTQYFQGRRFSLRKENILHYTYKKKKYPMSFNLLTMKRLNDRYMFSILKKTQYMYLQGVDFPSEKKILDYNCKKNYTQCHSIY